jgi:hypothetical protein
MIAWAAVIGAHGPVTLNIHDHAASRKFYEQALAPLGLSPSSMFCSGFRPG